MECVQFLLEQCGAPYNPKDRWGNMPIDEADTFGHQHVVEYLRNWQVKCESEAGDPSKNDGSDQNGLSSEKSTRSASPASNLSDISPYPKDSSDSSPLP